MKEIKFQSVSNIFTSNYTVNFFIFENNYFVKQNVINVPPPPQLIAMICSYQWTRSLKMIWKFINYTKSISLSNRVSNKITEHYTVSKSILSEKNFRNYHRFPVLSWSHSPFKARVPERIIQFLHFLKRHTNDRTNIRKSSESKEQRGKKVIWGPSYPTRHSSDKEGRGIYVYDGQGTE